MTLMSRERWMRKINQRYRKMNRRLVRTRANDPNWLRLGDYYVVNAKTNEVVCRHITFADFAGIAASRFGARRGGG
ncbi:MAG TPA: hypothetical protein VMJ93_11170 [Verrucomicrobiae bacterium]|nr:hypothetical protein [Verrucomicrobiae bacterium]